MNIVSIYATCVDFSDVYVFNIWRSFTIITFENTLHSSTSLIYQYMTLNWHCYFMLMGQTFYIIVAQ